MKEAFEITYIVGEKELTFKIGQSIFFVNVNYQPQYKTCKLCNSSHSTGTKQVYTIVPCTICGFTIRGNHAFSYNVKNSFTLKVQVIYDESDTETELEPRRCFTRMEEAEADVSQKEDNA